MASYDKTIPTGSTQFPTVDDNIRSNQDALEERFASEHQFPANPFASTTSGRHKFGVGTTATRDAAITIPASGMVWYNTSLGCWQIHNGSEWLPAGGTGVGTTAARNALASVPTNFAWLSTDEGFTSYYSGSAWVTLAPKGLFHGRITWATVAQVTIARGNSGKLRIEIDGVLTESAVDLTVDLSTADREDTSGSGGSALETASTWYYLYVANVAGVPVEHISFTAPVMDPAVGKVGYHPGTGAGATTWRCIGAVFNNSSSDILAFDRNLDGWMQFRLQSANLQFSPGTGVQSTYALVDLAAGTRKVPLTARAVRILARATADDLEYFYGHESLSGVTVSTSKTPHAMNAGDAGGNEQIAEGMFDIPIDATPNLAWGAIDNGYTFNSSATHVVTVVGWCDDLGIIG